LSASLLWRVLFYTWTASEIFIAIATRTRRGSGKVLDRGSMAILWVAIVASITGGEWVAAVSPENIFGGARWLKIAAIAVLTAGLAIRWTAILSLGKAFSANVAIRDTQTVYQSGLYRLVRHPSYTGLWLALFAVALHERNWLAAAIVLVLRDMQSALRVRSGLLQTTRRIAADEHPPATEELAVMLPDIFLNTIEKADVFGAPVAAQLYTLIHRVEDYNRYVRACRDWGVPPRQWDASLRPKLDAIGTAVAFLEPRLSHHIDALEAIQPPGPAAAVAAQNR